MCFPFGNFFYIYLRRNSSHGSRNSNLHRRVNRPLHILLDRNQSDFCDLSKSRAFVHTSLRRIRKISWNRKKIAVTLHCQKETDDTDNNKV